MLRLAFDVQLREERKRDPVVEAAKLLDLIGRARLLVEELVAWKAKHREATICVAILECLKAGVLRREPAARGDVDGKHHLSRVRGQAFRPTVKAGQLDVVDRAKTSLFHHKKI
jgi:hypothetical protein